MMRQGMECRARSWPVVAWPQERVETDARQVVLSLGTPHTDDRQVARRLAREAALAVLAHWFPGAGLRVESVAGQAPKVLHPDGSEAPVGLSISHAPGRTLVALGRDCRVGVDLCIPHPWTDLVGVAQDYLDEGVVKKIQKLSGDARGLAFSEHWVELEAVLKCLGCSLVERSLRPLNLMQCVEKQILFSGFVGVAAVAWYESSPVREKQKICNLPQYSRLGYW